MGLTIHFYQQFHPGPCAPGTQQTRKLVRLLADRGHRVELVACDFNVCNEQSEPPEVCMPAGGGRLEVHRLPTPRGMRASLNARLRTYGTFAWKAYCHSRRLPRADVVIGTVPTLFTAAAALQVAQGQRAPFILEVRDLWPDTLIFRRVVTGWKALVLRALANRLLRCAKRIVSLTPGMKLEILKKRVPRERLDVFTNGYDPAGFALAPGTRERVRGELGWEGRFVAVFTGMHVEVTAVETIVQTAAALKDRGDIRFDLFGQGQLKPAAIALAKSLGLNNIHFHDPVPKARVPELLAGADVALITLFQSPLIDIYFENKLVDYLGAGKAILAAMDGMQGDLVRRVQAGSVVGSFDHEGLARLVVAAAADPAGTERMGQNGKRFATERLLLPAILDRYADVIEAVGEHRADALPPWEPFPWPL